MTSLRASHQPLSSSSQPSSPVEEEDLGKPAAWEGDTSTLVSSTWKGKGRAHAVAGDEDEEEEEDDTETVIDEGHVPAASYPPLDEEEMESRRIEENLRRMAAMERDRRKKAREGRSEPSGTSGGGGGGWERRLETVDEGGFALPDDEPTTTTTNPFEDPRYAVPESIPMRGRRSPPRPLLGLPDPVRQHDPPPETPHRWWTDWLCGCREEDDEQAGHTNPME